jgi:NAD(P)-dependent dehydrogenase (short-subunit alcohol dehydrogenase family)
MDTRKTALVTGTASGLGRAIAVALARAGWYIALADVNDQENKETLALVQAAGGAGHIEHLDVSDLDAWQRLREKLQGDWKQIDLLVNNAGVGMGGEVGQLPVEDWRFIINVNLYGPIFGCHTLVDWMKQNPRGAHIVNVASLAVVVSAPGMAAYNVTKAGVLSLSETLYSELRPHNIAVTAVCPDFFDTNISRNARFQTEQQRRLAERLTTGGRMTSDDVARKVLRAVERKQFYLFVPWMAGLIWRFKRMSPVWALNTVNRYIQRKAAEVAAETREADEAEPVEPATADVS